MLTRSLLHAPDRLKGREKGSLSVLESGHFLPFFDGRENCNFSRKKSRKGANGTIGKPGTTVGEGTIDDYRNCDCDQDPVEPTCSATKKGSQKYHRALARLSLMSS